MERLTERDWKNKCAGYMWNVHPVKDIYDLPYYKKLADYEDAEEQGLLLRLPCKVGDTVYKVWYKPCHLGETMPDSYDCCGCMDECDLELAIFEYKVDSITFIINEFVLTTKNIVYFLTKEEAEQKLAEMGGE